jgi:putative flippase GtrA
MLEKQTTPAPPPTLAAYLGSFRSPQFVYFLAVGCTCAAISFSLRILLMSWLTYASAIAVSYFAGMLSAFILNRSFVFRGATNRLHNQVLWFVGVNALALLQTLLVSVLLADFLLPRLGITWHVREIAHIAGIATPVFSSFFGHKYFSFVKNELPNNR